MEKKITKKTTQKTPELTKLFSFFDKVIIFSSDEPQCYREYNKKVKNG